MATRQTANRSSALTEGQRAVALDVLGAVPFAQIAGLRPEARTRVLGLYLRDAPLLVKAIGESVARRSAASAMEAAHTLKSISAAVGAQRLASLCSQIEAIAKRGEIEGVHVLLSDLTDGLASAVRELTPLLVTLTTTNMDPPSARVLIVDDDDTMRALIGEALVEQGMTVLEASSGSEALVTYERDRPDLVMLDVMMPGMNGYDACAKLRKLPGGGDLLILMATGLDDPESIELSYLAGATDFIAKPLHLGLLRHRVRYLLRGQRDRRAAEQRIAHLAFHDDLTGLPNRAFLTRHLPYVVEQARRRQRAGAVLSLDLDGFKRVNDTLGHTAGDTLLREVATRLEQCLRRSDCVTRLDTDSNAPDAIARFGGDEFVVVLSDLASMDDATQIAQRIISTLSRPFQLGSQEFHVNCSIGIAPFPSGDAVAVDLLLGNADAAMYDAKRSGGARFQFYCAEMSRRARERLELETSLRHALERREFELFYQPKVDAQTGSADGVEALLRWRHPERGMVSPLDFIPIAESTGMIIPIGAWVIRQACAQAQAWSNQGLPDLAVAVNISTRQFRNRDLADTVRSALAEAGLSAHRLELEITEGSLMDDASHATSVLNELRAIGVRIAIDDFGTGYSSLSYLRHLPLDTIKVDRTFIRDVTTNQDSAAIATAILAMARSLRLQAVAEGVETAEQLAFLVGHGCPFVQGFFYSRPLPADGLAEWLRARLAARAEKGCIIQPSALGPAHALAKPARHS